MFLNNHLISNSNIDDMASSGEFYCSLIIRALQAAAKALAPAAEAPGGKKKTGKTSRTHSSKRTSFGVLCYHRGRARELHRQEQV